jgi:hypothetical protein
MDIRIKEISMYQVPAANCDSKPRYIVVTEADEIRAIQRNGWGDPDGKFDEITQQWVATAHSMQQYRESKRDG